MKSIMTVLRFEFRGFVNTKTFRIVTIIFVVAIIAVTSIPQIISGLQARGIGEGFGQNNVAALILSGDALTNEVYKNAFTDDALQGTGASSWADLSKDPPDTETLSEAIRNGEYFFALRYSGGTAFDLYLPGDNMFAMSAVGPIETLITDLAREAAIEALPKAEQDVARNISNLTSEPNINQIGGDAASNYWIGYVLIMFLFYVIMGYSNYVSSSVVTEKTSKAMELLITSVKPIHLMVGKVVGVGLAALVQVAVLVGAFAVGIMVNIGYWMKSGNALFELTQGENVGASIAFTVIIYFLLGFFLYAFLVAAFASTVSKPEEAATVITLPMVFMMVSLLSGFLILFGALNSTVAAVLSYIPFFTPIAMIARYTMGGAGTTELLIGIAIMSAAIVFIAILAAKIFRMGVMLYGVKATPGQIMRALKNS